jgi:pimeloyl-ACP methyl ester carboxylesterase
MIALIAATVIAAAPASATPDPVAPMRQEMAAAHDTIVASFSQINQRSGLGVALEERIDIDTPSVELSSKPAWMSGADFLSFNAVMAKMDATIVKQLASGVYHPLGAIRGADDTALKSPVDGMMQPLGVYVPPSYDPRKPTSLVVFLHGRTCSEADVIALPWVRAAADATGSIIIAPYARGDSQYVDPASVDVYEALAQAKRAFNVDPRRIYLAGHSMGGYGVFIVGPKHPDYWAAIMAASGGMTTQTQDTAISALRHVPIYLVIGANDEIVPAGYMKTNENLLTASGVETHYYEDPNGRHPIGTYAATYARAWHDMLSRTLNHPVPEENVQVPVGAQPMSGRAP